LLTTANGLAEAPLIAAASDAIKQKYLGRMTEEPLVASYAVVSRAHMASLTRRPSPELVLMLLASRPRPPRLETNG
jgi:hypothetical protein